MCPVAFFTSVYCSLHRLGAALLWLKSSGHFSQRFISEDQDAALPPRGGRNQDRLEEQGMFAADDAFLSTAQVVNTVPKRWALSSSFMLTGIVRQPGLEIISGEDKEASCPSLDIKAGSPTRLLARSAKLFGHNSARRRRFRQLSLRVALITSSRACFGALTGIRVIRPRR
jgi:hypothetical protein